MRRRFRASNPGFCVCFAFIDAKSNSQLIRVFDPGFFRKRLGEQPLNVLLSRWGRHRPWFCCSGQWVGIETQKRAGGMRARRWLSLHHYRCQAADCRDMGGRAQAERENRGPVDRDRDVQSFSHHQIRASALSNPAEADEPFVSVCVSSIRRVSR